MVRLHGGYSQTHRWLTHFARRMFKRVRNTLGAGKKREQSLGIQILTGAFFST